MCGIAGILNFNNELVQSSDLKNMTDIILHRGPDGEGHWTNDRGNVGFGHRRLAIIDLSENGRQPMHYLEGRYSITFNGEIYNYVELKDELTKQGYKFRSESDTEVLLALYDFKKEKCLEKLDGMFAFGIWDEKEQSLFCARDRFGEKPFHYYFDGQQFIFASEIKQIWKAGVSKTINEERFSSFLKTGQIDDQENPNETFYKHIEKLDAGHFLKVDVGGKLIAKKYWSIDISKPEFEGSFEQAVETFFELFKSSVRLRLRSDVPIGTSLSGGLDSSSICMMIDAMKLNNQKQTSFSARFKNYEKDEGKYIEEVIKACDNIEFHYIWPDENYFQDCFNEICYYQDEPIGSSSIVAQYSVMQLAKKNGVTVLIDGQGADEYLAGYKPYYPLYLNQLFYHDKIRFRAEVTNYNKLNEGVKTYYPPDNNESFRMKLGRYRRTLLNSPMPYKANELKQKLQKDTSSGELKTLLRYADRNSMAHSRETRLPFLSHELVEFVFSLPDHYKLNSGWSKYVLRKAMESILPPSICWRVDKVGFEAPQNNWLRTSAIQDEIIRASEKLKDISNVAFEKMTDQQKWRVLVCAKYLL